MTAGEGQNPGVEAFGRWLLRERELRGLAREEVARATKLAPAVIEALESGDAARMPPRASSSRTRIGTCGSRRAGSRWSR